VTVQNLIMVIENKYDAAFRRPNSPRMHVTVVAR
jgi:hypothetical protein